MENDLFKAYAEVDKILSFMEFQYVKKVPIKMRELFRNNGLKGYEPMIDKNIPLDQQKLQRKTLAILALLNLNYWCENQEEKQKLIKAYSENDQKREKEIREKYNPDNIFKKSNTAKEMENVVDEVTTIVEYKEESLIKKLLKKIMKLFKR